MHHAYCVNALLIMMSEASIYPRTSCHILFLLRYIHESFIRFWLNANNSECFVFTHNVIGNPQMEHDTPRNEIRPKGTNIIQKEKTFRGYFSQKSIILTLSL